MGKFKIITLLFILLPTMVVGQSLIKSSPLKHGSSGFTKVIGENEDGIFVLHHRNQSLNSDFYIERFKHDVSSSSLFKVTIPKASLEKIAVKEHTIAYLTQEGKRYRGKKTLRFIELSSYAYEKVISTSIEIDNYDFGQEVMPVHIFEDKSMFSIAMGLNIDGLSQLKLLEIGDNGKMKELATLKTSHKNNVIQYMDISADKHGNKYILARIREKYFNAPHYILYFYNAKEKRFTEKLLNNENTWLSSLELMYDEMNDITNVFSFFGDKPNQNKGYMLVSYSGVEMKKKVARFDEFETDFVGDLIGKGNAENGGVLSNFYVRKIRPKMDGGIIFVAEKFIKIDKTTMEYVNGSAQPMTKSVYNFDEVIVVSLDEDGDLDWQRKINKQQNSMYDGGYFSSIQVVFTEYNIYVIYNDKMNTAGNVVQHKMDIYGSTSEKLILRSSNYYQYIVPMQGSQIGYNRVVIPATINKTSQLVKLTYN